MRRTAHDQVADTIARTVGISPARAQAYVSGEREPAAWLRREIERLLNNGNTPQTKGTR